MNTSDKALVYEFLVNHVIGNVVSAAPVTTQTDNGRLTSSYEEDAIFSNLANSPHGFSFDMVTLARGTRYTADKSGALVAEGTLNTVRVLRYELTARASSGKLVGYSRFIASTNTLPDPFLGTIFIVRMWLEKDALIVHESQAGYADLVGADGSFKPVAVDGRYRYAVEEGRLAVQYEQDRFDVDADTLQRKPTSDTFPIQVSHEMIFPPPLVYV